MSAPVFRIDEDDVPWAGDKRLPWAINIRNEEYTAGEITHWHRGFHLPFENGWTISCQWGWGNYCSNRGGLFGIDDEVDPEETHTSPDSEIAIWDHKGNWAEFPDGDTVKGYVTVEQFLRLVIEVSRWDTIAPAAPYKLCGQRSLR